MTNEEKKAEQALRIIDMLLAALTTLPTLIASAQALYRRLKSGEEVSQDELDTLQARIEARNDRIQGA